jgi:hypothetical protein
MEQIEINVQKNIEEVEINVQPNVTQVIINEVVGAGVESVSGNLVDNTDPNNPIINGIQSIVAGTNVSVDDTDPANPVISATGGGGGAETFLELTDTPSTYTGQAGKFPKVNEDETGLEFGDAPAPNIEQVLAVGNYDGAYGFGSREYVGSFTNDPNSDEPYIYAAFLNDSILFGDFDPLGAFKDINISPIYESGKLFISSNYTTGINDGTIATEEWVQANAPSGAVDSVNGQTGVVVLDASDVGAEPTLGFTPEDVANKTTDITDAAGTYPDTPTVKNYIDLDENLFAIKSNFIGLLQIPAISGASNIGVNASGANNRVIFQPFRVGKPITINTISLMQNAANDGAGANLTVYIFDNSNDGFPGNKLLQSVSANGIFIGTQKEISFSVNVTLPRGNYWIGIHARDLNTIGGNPTFLGGVITTNSVIGSTISYSNNNNSQLIITTQPTDLGDNPATSISLNANINFPQIFIKLT